MSVDGPDAPASESPAMSLSDATSEALDRPGEILQVKTLMHLTVHVGMDGNESFASSGISPSGFSEDMSPQSSPVGAFMLPLRRRSDADAVRTPTGSARKLVDELASPQGPYTPGMDEPRKNRRASTSSVEFSREQIQSFETNLGRHYFFARLGASLTVQGGMMSVVDSDDLADVRQSNVGDVLKQGWLMKKGGVVPTWRRRWFTLSHSADGPILTYAKEKSPAGKAKTTVKTIRLSSSSQCSVVPKTKANSRDREFEFKVATSVDLAQREYFVQAISNVEMAAWIAAIKAAINDSQTNALHAGGLRSFWDKTGINGFLIHYGVRKCSNRNHVQTRVLELNFADQTIVNTKRGETLTTLPFAALRTIRVLTDNSEWGFGLEITWDKHRNWPLYLDTAAARDDLVALLQHITSGAIDPEQLRKRYPQLTLKTGSMERKQASHNATLKGRFHVKLHEAFLTFFPEHATLVRPWFVLPLKELRVSMDAATDTLYLGRHVMICDSAQECKSWYSAILAASILPREIMDAEMDKREKIRRTCVRTVMKLRKLLKASVKPEGNAPAKDQKLIDVMLKQLWTYVFPSDVFVSNTDVRWQEIGFQRGGPPSDLRASGLLGLHCLMYFVRHHTKLATSIMNRIRHGVSEGNLKNYPFAIACINVVATLVEFLGIGDAGSHFDGCVSSAPKTFVAFIANDVEKKGDATSSNALSRASLHASLSQYQTWDDLTGDVINTVFEDMFCILFPILDRLFVEMGAGYMEFGQVLLAFRKRVTVIFATEPPTWSALQVLASEPVTETLVAPSIISKQVH
ncbi:hypothetical protein SDRG_05465 [Saprolegnia diclina VS20]|uniref:ELMO domain-containing protein n=1 Tax=Saprolegnia diclina (strain VS20) TaxID=1156394 RepID=T0QTA0_SAPDV|nr:hypothetical protein SDRG_05465 [Saprolegnia diclina VS20]EQC37240.1 hypothetical protein SDRG_05465 [Saprolegnia diclina VS20]|eukprot:XP_008609402.1 hypothetical protein SDRG_05465 [Saprolegnia diclina VS20]